MIGYKAFNSDWTCRGKQYKVGESYHEDNVELCEHGMHFCTELNDIFQYYRYSKTMKLAKVKASGTIIGSDNNSKHVTSDLKVLEELDPNSEAVKLAVVKQNGAAIKYIDNPSEKVKLAAVEKGGWAIRYIDSPSEAVQMAAVKQFGWAIQYIDSPSETVQLEAVKKGGAAIQFIDNPSETVQLEAVKQDGWAIQYIVNPSVTVKIVAFLTSIKCNIKWYLTA